MTAYDTPATVEHAGHGHRAHDADGPRARRAATGPYNGSTTVSGTLVNTYTNQPVPNEPVTLTLTGTTQTCTATTNASGVASCSITPNEPAGTYSTTASFPGDTTQMPQLLPTSGSGTFTVTLAPTTFAYTGTTSVTNGGSATLSGVLTTSEPSPGTDVGGQTVTFTLGSGSALQSCSGTTNASGAASCTITDVNQTSGTVGISAGYSGNIYYQSSTAASTATVHTPTTLTVSAGTSDFADAGTVSGVLTNSITGATISGEPVTLTLNGTQSCTRHDERQRRGVVLHHAKRDGGDLCRGGFVRRRHLQGAAAALEHGSEQLHRDPRGDGHHLHGSVRRRDRVCRSPCRPT